MSGTLNTPLGDGQRPPGGGNNSPLDPSDDEPAAGWVPWFCSVPGHEFFVEIDEEYVRDNFNLYGLRNRVQYYDHALEMILMPEAPDEEDLSDADFLEVYRDAQDLYGLIHARFIISPRGLEIMREHYLSGVFGSCPRVLCEGQTVLPVGPSDELRVGRVKTYCPRCEQVYATKSKYSDVDGAYFGTSFPHIFCLTFPGIIPLVQPTPYVPRLFGFKISQSSGIIARAQQKSLESMVQASNKEETSDAKNAEDEKTGAPNTTEATTGQTEKASENPTVEG